jgi:hypothetical protein
VASAVVLLEKEGKNEVYWEGNEDKYRCRRKKYNYEERKKKRKEKRGSISMLLGAS